MTSVGLSYHALIPLDLTTRKGFFLFSMLPPDALLLPLSDVEVPEDVDMEAPEPMVRIGPPLKKAKPTRRPAAPVTPSIPAELPVVLDPETSSSLDASHLFDDDNLETEEADPSSPPHTRSSLRLSRSSKPNIKGKVKPVCLSILLFTILFFFTNLSL